MTTEVTVAKNGTGVVFHVWDIDHSKPICWQEGDKYLFRQNLIASYPMSHKHLALLLKNTGKVDQIVPASRGPKRVEP